MELIDFNNCQQSIRVYGGGVGRKNGIIYNSKNYLIKFPETSNDFKIISKTQKLFFTTLLAKRMENVFLPVFKELSELA